MGDVYTRIGYIKGATGATGAQGVKGDTGDAATIEVGTVTTVPYGQTASVVNSGTSGAAVFDFTIPQGRPGQETTDMQNLVIGAITTSSASFPVPAVGETGKVLWGKVVKWFSDMTALVATKLDVANVVNNLTTTASGYALDARQGKALSDSINSMMLSLGSVTTNSSQTFTVASSTRAIVYVFSAATSKQAAIIVNASGSGAMAASTIYMGADITWSTSYNALTITDRASGSTAFVYAVVFTGSITRAA